MNNQDAFERIMASLYDAMIDETRWPATSALIDEACGSTGNGLMVAEGPKNDVRLGSRTIRSGADNSQVKPAVRSRVSVAWSPSTRSGSPSASVV